MAGLGRKEFNAGDILLASEVQGYLQDQAVMVFDDAAARGSAIPTPSEGMLTYNKDTDALELYDGSAFGPVGSDAGLIHIETQNPSAVSAVNFNNVFSSAYDRYKIIATATATSTAVSLEFRFRVSGADNTAAQYDISVLNQDSTSVAGFRATAQTSTGNVVRGTTRQSVIIEVFDPFLALPSGYYHSKYGQNVDGGLSYFSSLFGYHRASTSFDGFSLFAGNSFSGKVSVFGYKD